MQPEDLTDGGEGLRIPGRVLTVAVVASPSLVATPQSPWGSGQEDSFSGLCTRSVSD